jgi:molybdopterin adenylyltransferase
MSAAEEHRRLAPDTLGFGVLTVSDSRTPADDTSGDAIRRLAAAAGHRVVASALVADDVAAIRGEVESLLATAGVDVVVTTGGTGYSPRDLTHVAVTPLFDVEIEGFGELFRMLSHRQVGAAAMLSRATAGVRRGRAIFVLPGSPKAVELAMAELILPEAAHLLSQARRPRRKG